MVPELVALTARGDQDAWNALVDRYARLVWSICRRHRLSDADVEDVSQTVWLQLVQQLDELRDARALPGWLATTTHRERIRVSRQQAADGPGPLAAPRAPSALGPGRPGRRGAPPGRAGGGAAGWVRRAVREVP
jgi:DNA-directed RNA polymerase specialized sigma24 family protein